MKKVKISTVIISILIVIIIWAIAIGVVLYMRDNLTNGQTDNTWISEDPLMQEIPVINFGTLTGNYMATNTSGVSTKIANVSLKQYQKFIEATKKYGFVYDVYSIKDNVITYSDKNSNEVETNQNALFVGLEQKYYFIYDRFAVSSDISPIFYYARNSDNIILKTTYSSKTKNMCIVVSLDEDKRIVGDY